jgi:threonine dehydrogenase-like Zn-dependent dehydrogenase
VAEVTLLGFPRAGEVALSTEEESPPRDGAVRVETLYTGLSAGTELTWFRGTNPYLYAGWDAELGVFRADRPARSYPIRDAGYMEVGRVTDSRHPAHSPGQVVAAAYGHRTSAVLDPARQVVVALPADLDPVLGVLVAHMGPICANGVLHAAAEERGRAVETLGDGVRDRRVLVLGGGVVGLLTGLFARHHGAAEVLVVDPTPARRAAAEALGLGALDDDGAAWAVVKDRWRHGPRDRGADVVFQCRGRDESLATALRGLRPQGTVIDLAFYVGGAGAVRLGEEFHHNGLAVRCAQIGRVPRGLADRWDRRRLAEETLGLLAAHGAALRRHLVSDVVPFAEAPALIRALSARRRHVLQAVFAVRPDG